MTTPKYPPEDNFTNSVEGAAAYEGYRSRMSGDDEWYDDYEDDDYYEDDYEDDDYDYEDDYDYNEW